MEAAQRTTGGTLTIKVETGTWTGACAEWEQSASPSMQRETETVSEDSKQNGPTFVGHYILWGTMGQLS